MSTGAPVTTKQGAQGPAGVAWNFVPSAKNAAFSATTGYLYQVTTGGAGAPASLVAAAAQASFPVAFKKVDAGVATLVITPNGADTIDGAASFSLTVQNEAVIMIAHATGWNIIGYYKLPHTHGTGVGPSSAVL